jgi:hypothetical protein
MKYCWYCLSEMEETEKPLFRNPFEPDRMVFERVYTCPCKEILNPDHHSEYRHAFVYEEDGKELDYYYYQLKMLSGKLMSSGVMNE